MYEIFQNTEVAFAVKTDAEIERAYYLFRIIQSQPMVKIGSKLTQFALAAHLPVEGLIRTTVFNHFCGGVTEEDCMPVIEKLYANNVHSILDYSAEGKEEEDAFEKAAKITINIINFAKEKSSMPFAVFKPTGFGRMELYEKVTEGHLLTEDEQAEWERVVERYNRVAKAAFENDVPLLIDAEDFSMQKAADDLIESMMVLYNKEKAIVWGTLQLYRYDRMDYLKGLHQRAIEKGFYIGMKLVRGAYMEIERERAVKMGYPDPICATKADTDANCNAVLKYMFENIDRMSVYNGTHNEESSFLFAGPYIAYDSAAFKKEGIQYVVLAGSSEIKKWQELMPSFQVPLKRIAVFSPYKDKLREREYDELPLTGLPFTWQELIHRERGGMRIEVFKLDSMD